MTEKGGACFFEKMTTVLRIPFNGSKTIANLDQQVEKKVKEIIAKLKASHSKFEDPDFGPTETDEHGALALYGPNGPPPPTGHSKYPPADTIRWDRPQYADDKFQHHDDGEEVDDDGETEEEEDEFGPSKGSDDKAWCMHGELFLGGSSSGDVVQGKLGDCWFLSAIAVIGAQQRLLENCFWRTDSFKEYGMFVCIFQKDCEFIFVIIDDRIPVFESNGKVVFAQCRDPNELWVPLLEKAYAKLFGCYKSLIGGYTHYGIADLTGFSPRLIGLKPGTMGYSDAMTDTEIWETLIRYRDWGCLMGCSIQGGAGKVEADVGQGLNMGHAYSLLDIRELGDAKKTKLIKLRNPWGRGEWTGPWSDESAEFTANEQRIKEVFKHENAAENIVQNRSDGTFLMSFEDWKTRFTSLFIAINFPKDKWRGSYYKGQWSGDTGGNRQMTTWLSNPKIKFTVKETRKIFVGLYIKDSRLTLGVDYYKDPMYEVGIGFDIVRQNEFDLSFKERVERSTDTGTAVTDPKATDVAIIGSHPYTAISKQSKQPPYMFGTTQVETEIPPGEYYIVPSLYKRKQAGTFFLTVYCDGPFDMEGAVQVAAEQKPPKNTKGEEFAKMTQVQFNEKKESIREKIVNEAKKLGITLDKMVRLFPESDMKNGVSGGVLVRSAFKRRMMDIGFSLADFPDQDFDVLDENSDGTISTQEFLNFFKEGLQFEDTKDMPPVPEPPVDDLLFEPVDLEGVLTVKVFEGRGLKKVNTWFSNGNGNKEKDKDKETIGNNNNNTSNNNNNTSNTVGKGLECASKSLRPIIKYDIIAAEKERQSQLLVLQKKMKEMTGQQIRKKLPVIKEDEVRDMLDDDIDDKALQRGITTEKRAVNLNLKNSLIKTAVSLDTSLEFADARSMKSCRVGGTGSGISADEKQKVIAKEAALKLQYKDPKLIEMELCRVRFLCRNSSDLSILRKKTRTKAKSDYHSYSWLMDYLEVTFHDNSWAYPRSTYPMYKGRDARPAFEPPVVYDENAVGAVAEVGVGTISTSVTSLTTSLATAGVSASSRTLVVPPLNTNKDPTTKIGCILDVSFWDFIIDCSIDLSRAVSDVNGRLTSTSVKKIDLPRSVAPTPVPMTSFKLKIGSSPTPVNKRSNPGTASVISKQSVNQQRNIILEAKEKLKLISEEKVYHEVFRRMIVVPSIYFCFFTNTNINNNLNTDNNINNIESQY
eukprot:gene3480-6926_t